MKPTVPQNAGRELWGGDFNRNNLVCVCVCTCARVHTGELGPGRDTFKPGVGERQVTEKDEGNSTVPAASSSLLCRY